MRSGATEIQAGQPEAVARVSEQRTPREELIEPRLSVEEMPAGHSVVALEIYRVQHLPRGHQLRNPRGATLQRFQRDIAEAVPLGRPVAVSQRVRRVLQ